MHYGVPGMKWGVRKQRTYDTSTAYGRMKTAKKQYKSGYVDHTKYDDLGREVIELGKRHFKVS